MLPALFKVEYSSPYPISFYNFTINIRLSWLMDTYYEQLLLRQHYPQIRDIMLVFVKYVHGLLQRAGN